MNGLWLAKPEQGAYFHVRTGKHTQTYTNLPVGTPLFWAMSVQAREAQLWTTARNGWPVLTMLRPSADWAQSYITTDDPRQLHYPPKGVLP